MSEFKVGDKIVYHSLPHQRLFYVKASLSDSIVVRECLDEAGAKCFSEFHPYTDIRHATTQEIAAGHRIDKPSNSRELETIDEPVGSLQELHPEFAKVLHENFLELLGDDFPIENQISPNCQSRDV